MARALIVGVGPGAPDLVTERARAAVASADAILAWQLNLTPLAGTYDGKRLFIQAPGDYDAVAARAIEWAREANATLAVVRIGDAVVSAGLTGLLTLLGGFEIEVVPGISSVQVAAALARINLDEAVVSSFHEERDLERERAFVHGAFLGGRHLVVLTGPEQPPDATAGYLIDRGIGPTTQALVAESLSLPDERVVRGSLADIARGSYHWLSILVVIHPHGIDPTQRSMRSVRPPGAQTEAPQRRGRAHGPSEGSFSPPGGTRRARSE